MDQNVDEEAVSTSGRSTVFTTLAVIALVWYCVLWALSLLGCSTARKRYRNRPRSPLASASPESVPGVSIIRPLKGLDVNLYENLESSFTQDYPNFEILMSVSTPDDQALSVVRDLIAKYPRVDAKYIIGDEQVGVNPKVNNLMRPVKQAKNDILWVLDSNVLVDRGTLARSVDALVGPPQNESNSPSAKKRRIGLVHHVPFAFGSELEWGSRIEEAFLNTNHAKMYIAINAVAIDSCVVGKSNMYRRSDLSRLTGELKPMKDSAPNDSVTGLPAFARFLAEDNMIAGALWHELGLRHDLSCDVAGNAVGNMPFMAYVWRRVRWIRVRKHMVTAATLIEPFTECIMLSFLGTWSIHYLFTIPTWFTFLLHYVLWITLDLDVYESLAGQPLPSQKRWSFFSAWALRELLALPIWMFAITGDQVEWRGRKYEIMKNGEAKRNSSATSHRWQALWSRFRGIDYEQLNQHDDFVN